MARLCNEEGPVRLESGSERCIQRSSSRAWIGADDDLISIEEEEEFGNGESNHQQITSSSSSSSSSSLIGSPVLTITRPIELECHVCAHLLFPPIFQCKNNHIACSACCSELKKKCLYCFKPIGSSNTRCRGLEKFIESIDRISCKNAMYGCKKMIPYSKQSEHELVCPNAICCCPYPSCHYADFSKNMYLHFRVEHTTSTTLFTYNTTLLLCVDINQKHLFLQEQNENVIFILNHEVQENGRAFNVDCVGLGTLRTCFVYELTAKIRETSISLQSVPEIYTEWSKDAPRKNYLKVPYGFAGYDGLLFLSVGIKKSISSEFEEEVEEAGNEDHDMSNRSLQVVLTNPGILDCSICLEPLGSPVFQCQNGHLACSSCCSKVKTTSSVCFPIGCHFRRCRSLERLIDSIMISCKYARNGCERTLAYSSRSIHEQWCRHIRYFCPLCPFSSSSSHLCDHFEIKHAASTIRFTYNTTFSLCVDIDQKHLFLQEQHEGAIFILNHEVLEHGRVFNIDFVGPNISKNFLTYQLTAKSPETSRTLKSVPETYTKWFKHPPTKNYLTVPSEFAGYNGLLSLSIDIVMFYTKRLECMD